MTHPSASLARLTCVRTCACCSVMLHAPAPLRPADGFGCITQLAQETFGHSRVVLLSNSAGTPDDADHSEADALERSLKLPVMRRRHKKPRGFESIRAHFGDVPASDLIMVGDRFLTDVVFGNAHGMLTVHTRVRGPARHVGARARASPTDVGCEYVISTASWLSSVPFAPQAISARGEPLVVRICRRLEVRACPAHPLGRMLLSRGLAPVRRVGLSPSSLD